jgi:hypothetical protein
LAPIPPPSSPTVKAIYEAYEKKQRRTWRRRVGAGDIGHECERHIWYTFRNASVEKIPGRVLRLFETGNLEEDRLVQNLRSIGAAVHDHDPETGEQFEVPALDGHFLGRLDTIVTGLLEAPSKLHVAEFKTSNEKSFRRLQKERLQKAQPGHYAQLQVYMELTGINRGVYISVCKDTDELYLERVYPDPVFANALMDKARRVIKATRPPERISQDPDFYVCRFCRHSEVCHFQLGAPRHCRTCLHSSPVADGEWACAVAGNELIPKEIQKTGCGSDHRYIPDLVPGEQIDVQGTAVVYRLVDGTTWDDTGNVIEDEEAADIEGAR